MNKNWLIRTKNNHILGPVSREKIRELIGNGSIKGDDEICAGNGYWIYVREQDLVAKYILNNENQPFNPVQEAEPVLALSPLAEDLAYPEDEALPGQKDLEYPESVEESQTDITKVGMSLQDFHNDDEDVSLGDVDEDGDSSDLLAEQDKKKSSASKRLTAQKKVTDEVAIPKLKNRRKKTAPVPKKEVKKSFLDAKTLILLLFALLIFALVLLNNRSDLIKTFINETTRVNIIEKVYAQAVIKDAKKKSGLIL